MDPEELAKRANRRDCCRRVCPCFYLRANITNSEQALKWLKTMLTIQIVFFVIYVIMSTQTRKIYTLPFAIFIGCVIIWMSLGAALQLYSIVSHLNFDLRPPTFRSTTMPSEKCTAFCW